MALTDAQLALTKLYLAGMNRAPEKGGLDYWTAQLATGKSFDSVVNTIFSLDVVKAIYPDALSNADFISQVYTNVFGKAPDADGLTYWLGKLGGGQARSTLVMQIIDAGLSAADGTPGKSFITDHFSVAQHAVEQQVARNLEFTPDVLKTVMSLVSLTRDGVKFADSIIDAINDHGGLLAAISTTPTPSTPSTPAVTPPAAGATSVQRPADKAVADHVASDGGLLTPHGDAPVELLGIHTAADYLDLAYR